MTVDLFAGIPVRDYGPAAAWYERLLGAPPSFLPTTPMRVWELTDHRYVYIAVRPEHDDTHMRADVGSAGLVVGQQVACPADAGVQVGQEGVQRRPLRLDGGAEVEL